MDSWQREGWAKLRARFPHASVFVFIIAFWALQSLLLTAERILERAGDTPKILVGRLVTTCAGAIISTLIWKIHQSQRGRALWFRILSAAALPAPAAAVHSAVNFLVFQLLLGKANMQAATIESYSMAMVFWYWCYIAISGLLLALAYSTELAHRERDLARLEQLAHTAQLRALRYQINPHFMFNTLNSIAALICTSKNTAAERMVENLGDFLRASLALDPQDDHPLQQEVHLLSLYLDIETLRYPERIAYLLDIDPPAERALVPSLILQPLTENVFRHAVGVSSSLVDLKISAAIRDAVLIIEVSNSAPTNAKSGSSGTGIGLKNVEDRLRARFGDAQSFNVQQSPEGGFAVELRIPATFSGTR